jgi:hypothetical protein
VREIVEGCLLLAGGQAHQGAGGTDILEIPCLSQVPEDDPASSGSLGGFD